MQQDIIGDILSLLAFIEVQFYNYLLSLLAYIEVQFYNYH